MARLALKLDVLRALFARSGNQCAFEGCSQVLINHKNQFVGQICHIEAANKGGERFNSESTDEERRSYNNLILLCYPHHIETNDVDEFTVEKLKLIKQKHEAIFKDNPFNVGDEQLSTISKEMGKYWEEIDRLNKIEHLYQNSGLAMEVSSKNDFFDILASARDSVAGMEMISDSIKIGSAFAATAVISIAAVFPPLSAVTLLWGKTVADLLSERNKQKKLRGFLVRSKFSGSAGYSVRTFGRVTSTSALQ